MDTAMHYRLRGSELTRLNAFEYAMCINVVKMTDEESEAALADAKSGQLSGKRDERWSRWRMRRPRQRKRRPN